MARGGWMLLTLLWPSFGVAQDQVVLQTDGQSSRLVIPCRIVDYTGEKITVEFKSGVPSKSYPAEQVVEVRTDWLPAHEQGRRQLTERKLDDSAKSLKEALKDEQRSWVRREILASLIRVAVRQKNRSLAGVRFLTLLEQDKATRHFGLIPLLWATEVLTDTERTQAQAWLSASTDAAKLLGASWLLDDRTLSESAVTELQSLQRSTDERIRLLAQAQTWRSKLKTLDVGELELQRWEARIRELPVSLRGGPSFVLGRGWVLRRDHERAATVFLWLPLMDDSDPHLTARAGVEAASSLKRLGQNEAARRLLEEIASRFPDTEFGESAKATQDSPPKNSLLKKDAQ